MLVGSNMVNMNTPLLTEVVLCDALLLSHGMVIPFTKVNWKIIMCWCTNVSIVFIIIGKNCYTFSNSSWSHDRMNYLIIFGGHRVVSCFCSAVWSVAIDSVLFSHLTSTGIVFNPVNWQTGYWLLVQYPFGLFVYWVQWYLFSVDTPLWSPCAYKLKSTKIRPQNSNTRSIDIMEVKCNGKARIESG